MIIKRKLFSNNYNYVEEILSCSKNDILDFKHKGYPKFYIDYLEKINPIIIREILEKEGSTFSFPFAINLNNINQDDIEVIKNGKMFLMGFATDPELLGFDLAYFGDDGKFYNKTGISFFTKFKEISDIKKFILSEIMGSEKYGSDYWDGPEMPQSISKIVKAIEKL